MINTYTKLKFYNTTVNLLQFQHFDICPMSHVNRKEILNNFFFFHSKPQKKIHRTKSHEPKQFCIGKCPNEFFFCFDENGERFYSVKITSSLVHCSKTTKFSWKCLSIDSCYRGVYIVLYIVSDMRTSRKLPVGGKWKTRYLIVNEDK